nr:hypothetical protein [Tanacetum cinerariifolium]
MKIEFTAMHVYDKALTWHQQVVKRYGVRCTWELYEHEALSRFRAVFEDLMVKLKNLKGLKDEINMPIRMFKLTTLVDAFSMARMQEATNNAMKPRYTPTQSNYKFNNVGGEYKGTRLLPWPTTTPLALLALN